MTIEHFFTWSTLRQKLYVAFFGEKRAIAIISFAIKPKSIAIAP
ncbi:hypothetical protein [Nostoc sp. UHCC 0252]|nr:hypothetical protein [Nostoc sp. UHCC 0252]MEA5602668.1 hypothetical protein [Nostoc sp. UHCC 0252]